MLWLFLSGEAPDELGIEALSMWDWDVDDVWNVLLLSASARSNHRHFPRRFTQSRIEVETHNIQAPYFLSIFSFTSAPTTILLQVTHDFLPRYQRERQRDLLPSKNPESG